MFFLQILVAVAVCLWPATPGRAADSTAKATTDQAVSHTEHDLTIVNSQLVWNGPKRKDNQTQLKAALVNVVALLRELFPEGNFILSPGIGTVTLEELKLRHANAEETLQAICIASGQAVAWRNANAPTAAVDPATGLPLPAVPPAQKAQPLYVLYPNPEAALVNPKPELQVEAFSLAGYFESELKKTGPKDFDQFIATQVEEISKLIQETIQHYNELDKTLNPGNSRPRSECSVQFHANAKLLIVMGDPQGVSVAAKIVGALPGVRSPNYQPAVQMREVPVAIPASPGNAEPIFPAPTRRASGAPR